MIASRSSQTLTLFKCSVTSSSQRDRSGSCWLGQAGQGAPQACLQSCCLGTSFHELTGAGLPSCTGPPFSWVLCLPSWFTPQFPVEHIFLSSFPRQSAWQAKFGDVTENAFILRSTLIESLDEQNVLGWE